MPHRQFTAFTLILDSPWFPTQLHRPQVAPGDIIRHLVVPHPLFELVTDEIESTLDPEHMVVLVGPAGVGKDCLLRDLVQRQNCDLPPSSPPRALFVDIPSAQRAGLVWKDLWQEILTVLEESLPQFRIDPDAIAADLASRPLEPDRVYRPTRDRARTTDGALFRSVRHACIDQGVRLLVLNEALNLFVNERSRSARQQLDVLRSLSTAVPGLCIIFASTARLLSSFQLSAELLRRLRFCYFPRYGSDLGVTGEKRSFDSDPEFFARTVATFNSHVPEDFQLNFTAKQLESLYRGTHGCIGILAPWLRSAFNRASRNGVPLKWKNFSQTSLRAGALRRIVAECEEGERLVSRDFDFGFPGIDAGSDPPQSPAPTPGGYRKRRGRTEVPLKLV